MNKSTWLSSIAGCLVLAVLASCAERDAPQKDMPSSTTIPSQEESVTRQDAESEATPSTAQQPSAGKVIFDLTPPVNPDDPLTYPIVEQAKLDLARRFGVSIDAITVSLVIGQEFSNEAFYCQATKERAARDVSPVVITGQTILLSTGGLKYEYHASGQQVIFCRQLK